MKKETFVTKDQLDEIIKTYPTPFYLYDERGIRRNLKRKLCFNTRESICNKVLSLFSFIRR